MTANPIQQLESYGPEQCSVMETTEARAWCRRLASQHGENFPVLSALVPASLRDDFAAVYAFCRWADDLGDEAGDAERSGDLLAWWRDELERCFEGDPRHPVFVALRPTIERHDLPMEPFHDLIGAFEQDQRVTRYDDWEQLLDYCRRSANPVGRLVLMVLGEARTPALFEPSDAICTALQLTNHWQDLGRDLIERDRIYAPSEVNDIEEFEDRLRQSAIQGYAVDREFLEESRQLVRSLVDRTWPIYERGEALFPMLRPASRPIVRLFAIGGQRVLRKIELWNYETTLHRPTLGRLERSLLVGRTWLNSRVARLRKDGAA